MKAIIYTQSTTNTPIEYNLRFDERFGHFTTLGWRIDFDRLFDYIYSAHGTDIIQKVVIKYD